MSYSFRNQPTLVVVCFWFIVEIILHPHSLELFVSDYIFVCKIQNNHMKYTEATAKEHFKRLYEMKGTISMMSVSFDTIKAKQTSIYSSSLVLLSCLYISTSLFFRLLPYSDAACCLKYPRHSLCLALPHKKHTKPQAQEYKYILIQTHTLMICPNSSCPCFFPLYSVHPFPSSRLSFSFPLWLSVRMDASAGDSWNLIHTGMEGGRQGERDGENERGRGGWEGLSVGHSDKEETQSLRDCWG